MRDIRYGLRTLLKSPGFSIVAVLALALGIGANTAIFSVVNAILIRPLPYKDSGRLVVLWENNRRQGWNRVGVSGPTYFDWKEQSTLFETMSLHEPGTGTLTGLGEPEQFPGMRVTPNFFEVLGAKVQLGRLFTAADEAGGRHNVAIITNGFWQRRLGGRKDIIGLVCQVDGLPYTVVGVLSPDFWLPVPAEGFVPWPAQELRGFARSNGPRFGVLGRLKPGVTMQQAQAELSAIAQRIAAKETSMRDWGATVLPLQKVITESIRPALLVLLGAVAFVLLIACTNVANLLLARGTGRQREVAIRAAVGAGRWQIVRQLLTESLILSLTGGALGLLLASWGVQVLGNVLPQHISVEGSSDAIALATAGIDWRVLLFTLAASLATGLLFGLAPALAASGTSPIDALKEGGRTGSGLRHNRLRDALVVGEVALALVLLAGAGLMIRSFWHMQNTNPGFRSDHVLTLEMELPTDTKYRRDEERGRVFQRFLEAVRRVPGVQSAALTHIVPFTDYEDRTGFTIEGRSTLAPGQRMEADWRAVSPGYFQTLGIPRLYGRDFNDADNRDRPCVVIVDQGLMRSYFGAENPVGRYLQFTRDKCEIAGVVGQVKHAGLNREPRPTIYVPYLITGQNRMSIVVRSAADPVGLANAIKHAVWSVDAGQPLYNIRTMDELIGDSVAAPRFTFILLGVFAFSALALAALGIYGVLAYSVSRRRQEIGIRMALGAASSDVLAGVMKHAAALTGIGLACGVAAALALTRALSSLVYGVTTTDLPTFAVVVVVLGLVALAAGYIPARRATRVEPIQALRYE